MLCQVLKIKAGPKYRFATVQVGSHIGECLAGPDVVEGPARIVTEFRTVGTRLEAVVKVYPAHQHNLGLAA